MPLAPGAQFERYEIVNLVGRGGMGEVYRAVDTRLHRPVALKVLRQDKDGGLAEADRVARLLREARAAASLNHPNSVAIYELGQAEGIVYIAMEFVQGQSLRALCKDRSFSVDTRAGWLVDAARALAAAHRAGIVHRDVKPSNIMVSEAGVVKVLDFGLAKPTMAGNPATFQTLKGQVVGTARYMAPEQLAGIPHDARADQYAFGVTAYELFVGHYPDGKVPPIAQAVPGFPAELSDVVARMIAPRPEARFPSMEEVAAAIRPFRGASQAWLGTAQVVGTPGSIAGAVSGPAVASGGNPLVPPPPVVGPPSAEEPNGPPTETFAGRGTAFDVPIGQAAAPAVGAAPPPGAFDTTTRDPPRAAPTELGVPLAASAMQADALAPTPLAANVLPPMAPSAMVPPGQIAPQPHAKPKPSTMAMPGAPQAPAAKGKDAPGAKTLPLSWGGGESAGPRPAAGMPPPGTPGGYVGNAAPGTSPLAAPITNAGSVVGAPSGVGAKVDSIPPPNPSLGISPHALPPHVMPPAQAHATNGPHANGMQPAPAPHPSVMPPGQAALAQAAPHLHLPPRTPAPINAPLPPPQAAFNPNASQAGPPHSPPHAPPQAAFNPNASQAGPPHAPPQAAFNPNASQAGPPHAPPQAAFNPNASQAGPPHAPPQAAFNPNASQAGPPHAPPQAAFNPNASQAGPPHAPPQAAFNPNASQAGPPQAAMNGGALVNAPSHDPSLPPPPPAPNVPDSYELPGSGGHNWLIIVLAVLLVGIVVTGGAVLYFQHR